MVRITIIFGVLLIALGLGDYYIRSANRLTELIPAALGFTMVVLGLVGLKASLRKNAMHAAVLLGLLGFAFNVRALSDLGQEILKSPDFAQSLMALLCGAFMVMAVKSFVDARRSRPAAATAPPVEPPPASGSNEANEAGQSKGSASAA